MSERTLRRLIAVLGVGNLESALHTINHGVDVGDSDPGWLGPVDLVALLLATALFASHPQPLIRIHPEHAVSWGLQE